MPKGIGRMPFFSRASLVGSQVLIGALVMVWSDHAVGQSLTGTWEDDDCMTAFELEADGRFKEHGLDLDDLFGNWSYGRSGFQFRYDNGETIYAPLNGGRFVVRYSTSNGSNFACTFVHK